NSPVIGADGELDYIVHRVADVTEFVRLKQHGGEQEKLMQELRTRGEQMESEVFKRAQDIQEVNAALREMADELNRSLAAQREVTERLNLALGSGEVGTWSWDPRADLINADEFMARLFGLPSSGFPKRLAGFLACLDPLDRQRVRQECERSATSGAEYDTEYRVVHPDGGERVVAARGKVYRDEHGQIVRMAGVCWDLTQRKRAEEEIRRLNAELEQRVAERTAELAESNRDLAQKNQENEMFVYSVSHDLRSPLVNLQGFSKELAAVCDELRALVVENDLPLPAKRRALTLLDGEGLDSIRFIQSAVLRLSNIIDALLRLSRAGRVEYQCQDIDVQGTVARIV
ncbi:MAG: PAS domain-containing protein, partial [Pirellulales bacterium]